VAALLVLGDDAKDGTKSLEISSFGDFLVAAPVIIFFGVLAAMPLAIVLDLMTRRSGDRPRRRRRAWLHPFRAIKASLAPYGRMREVMGNARRANLLHLRYASASALESPEFARRLRTVLEESGGMLVKFGQIASTRTDILPDALTDELANLRADVRTVDADDVRAVIEHELGEPAEQAFQSFDWEPLAAASIGQTHRAVLLTGEPVVLKVQRPGIDEVIARDAAVLRLAARQLERRVDAARSIGLCSLADELIAGVEEELDYLHEAAVGTRLRENRIDDPGIDVPPVHPTLSTGRVLVMDEVVGRSIGEAEAVDAAPISRPDLARRVLSSFLGQILSDGLYHADPHPGNLFIDAAGTIWLLDFGSVGRLDPLALDGLRGIALGVAMNDAGVLARAARDLAGDAGLVDLRALEADLGAQLAQLDSAGGIDPQLIANVLSVMDRHGLRPPASITLLARALLTLEGTLSILDPGFDLAAEGEQIVTHDHRDAFGTPEEILQREALRSLPALRTLPEHIETLANQLRAGRLTVRTERYAGGDREIVDGWIDRIVLAAVGGFGAVASALLLFAASGTADEDIKNSLWVLGFAGLTFAAVVLMRSAARALRRLPVRID
jgi:ubiquinone biosynthesis protein